MYKYYREKLHVNHLWELKGEKILLEQMPSYSHREVPVKK